MEKEIIDADVVGEENTNEKNNKIHWEKKYTRILLYLGAFIIIYSGAYYLFLPPFSIHALSSYIYLFIGILVCIMTFVYLGTSLIVQSSPKIDKKILDFKIKLASLNFSLSKKKKRKNIRRRVSKDHNQKVFSSEDFTTAAVGIGASFIFIFSILISSLVGTQMFNAKAYYSQLHVTQGTKEEFNQLYNYHDENLKLPIIDKDLSYRLAETKLSTFGDQYEINKSNFDIQSVHRNGVDELIRTVPLEYANLFISIGNMNKGTAGYIEVNVITQEAKLITLPEGQGLKYVDSAKFNSDLKRYLRFNNLSYLFDEYYFEIDDNGAPYWIVPTYVNEISLFGGPSPKGVIMLNAVTGEINYFPIGEEPKWIDHVVSRLTIISQAQNYLRYKNGWFNAQFGSKKDVYMLSDGYNYFIKDGESYYVSCITSTNGNDETSIGFMSINLKNKKAAMYSIEGITETRAQEISEFDDRVKAQRFTATWPILVNYYDEPTYFLTLKNTVQVQKYVYVDVRTGDKIAIGDTVEAAKKEYELLIGNVEKPNPDHATAEGIVDRVRDNGTTKEFTLVGDTTHYYQVSVDLSLDARFLQTGDNITVKYLENANKRDVKELIKK